MSDIGSKIRELRIAENLTQENLAAELNVSFQSASRWENGISTSDISLLPVIARFFGVSADYLLGMQDDENEASKHELEQEYWEKRSCGDIDAAYEIMLKGRKLFPRDMHFCVNLAEVMELFEGGNKSQIARYAEQQFSKQILNLCERVLDESRDEEDRFRALKLLTGNHMKAGNINEAIKIANGMADIMHSKEVLLGELLSGEEKKKASGEYPDHG